MCLCFCVPVCLCPCRLIDEALAAGVPVAVCSTSNEKAVGAIVRVMLGPERAAAMRIFAGDVVPRKKPDPVSEPRLPRRSLQPDGSLPETVSRALQTSVPSDPVPRAAVHWLLPVGASHGHAALQGIQPPHLSVGEGCLALRSRSARGRLHLNRLSRAHLVVGMPLRVPCVGSLQRHCIHSFLSPACPPVSAALRR